MATATAMTTTTTKTIATKTACGTGDTAAITTGANADTDADAEREHEDCARAAVAGNELLVAGDDGDAAHDDVRKEEGCSVAMPEMETAVGQSSVRKRVSAALKISKRESRTAAGPKRAVNEALMKQDVPKL